MEAAVKEHQLFSQTFKESALQVTGIESSETEFEFHQIINSSCVRFVFACDSSYTS